MTTLADEMAVYTEAVRDAIGQLFAEHAVAGDQSVLTRLIKAAEQVDQPLCSAARCWTPHNLTYRSCCDTYVCDDDQPEHDRACTEFVAQLREEAL